MRAPACTVPELGPALLGAGGRECLASLRDDQARVGADDGVRAVRHGDRPLGRLAERQAADAEHRRLLLDAARVGQHDLAPPRSAPTKSR